MLYNLLLCSDVRCPHRELALLLLRRLLREPHARRHLHPLLDRSEPVSRLCTTWCNLFGQGFISVGKLRMCSDAFLRIEPVSRLLFFSGASLSAGSAPLGATFWPELHQRGGTPSVFWRVTRRHFWLGLIHRELAMPHFVFYALIWIYEKLAMTYFVF